MSSISSSLRFLNPDSFIHSDLIFSQREIKIKNCYLFLDSLINLEFNTCKFKLYADPEEDFFLEMFFDDSFLSRLDLTFEYASLKGIPD
jgi:hypothetical protein